MRITSLKRILRWRLVIANNSSPPLWRGLVLLIFFGEFMKAVGTMSTFGFITDSVENAMDKHFAYFFAAKNMQGETLINTPSFDYILMLHDGNPDALRDALLTKLESHFKELFDSVGVDVEYQGIDNDRDGKLKFVISVAVIEGGATYDLTTAVIVSGKTFELINKGRLNARKRK